MNKTLANDIRAIFQKISLLYKKYSSTVPLENTIKLFRLSIYGWVIINTLLLIPGHEYFWGIYSFVAPISNHSTLFAKIATVLNNEMVAPYYPIFIILQIFFCILCIKNIFPRLSGLLVLFFTINLDNKIYTTLDGGNNIIHLMLIYCLFMILPQRNQNKNIQSFNIASSNMAIIVARFQLVCVYATAGWLKVTGSLWTKGIALYYTLNVDEYTHPLLKELINTHPAFSTLGSYGTLLFQLSFPFLIWFPKARPVLMLVGTFLHLSIAFGMGLLSFGLAMIMSYVCFYEDSKAKKVLRAFFKPSKLTVAIDSQCKNCKIFQKVISKLTNKIIWDDSRLTRNKFLSKISYKERNTRIYSSDTEEQIYSGFQTIEEIIKRTYFLNTLTPIISTIRYLGIGDKLYDFLVIKRSWRSACKEGQCEI